MSDETLSIADYERVINHQQARIVELERELGEARAVVPADVFSTIVATLYNCPGIFPHRQTALKWIQGFKAQEVSDDANQGRVRGDSNRGA